MLFYTRTVEDTYQELRTLSSGISRREAARRLQSYGPNAIKIKGTSLWKTLIEPFANVFMLVLFIAVIISFTHNALFDAFIIIAIMMVSAVIYYTQRFSTERILRSLQKTAAQQVSVRRGGEDIFIDATQLVPGDIIHLREGDKVPADIRIAESSSLRADEALLTGESEPVSKHGDVLEGKKEVYEQTNMLFQGSFVVAGHATGIVVATGNQTEFGHIAQLSKKTDSSSVSPVQKKIDKLLTYIIIVVTSLAVVAFVLALIRGIEFTEALRFVIAMTVSAVPESLPVAISVILVLGMRRMSAKKALVRTMRAIETVGVITTIATDKTGTLTENKLSVQEIWQPEDFTHHLPTIVHRTINHQGERGDPLDDAMNRFVLDQKGVELKGEAVDTLPFDQVFSMSGNIWRHQGQLHLVIKGAPEQVLKRSHLSRSQLSTAEKALHSLTSQGYRVIALATAEVAAPFKVFSDMQPSQKLEFVGFLGIADTLRPTSRRAIHVAQQAGVSVRMITGDHFETAYQIGKQLGLVDSRDQVFDSREIDDLTDAQLKKKILNSRVFSRVTPENKFRILQILKLKEITAMTGDGVNDVPALSNAHVGIAMGSGAQIAKDAGEIILLNDNFASIVTAMKEGRIIFSNIRRMLFYLLSTNIAEVLIMIIALIIGLPLPLVPVQILWINLVSETSIVIPLGLEPGEKDIMKRKPIDPKAPLLSRYLMSRIVLVAVVITGLTLAFYMHFAGLYGHEYGQTIVFTSLAVMVWANAFNARSTYESALRRLRVWSWPFFAGLAISIFLQVIAVFGPLQGILHVHPIAIGDLFITSVISFITVIVVVEIHKFIGRRLRNKKALDRA